FCLFVMFFLFLCFFFFFCEFVFFCFFFFFQAEDGIRDFKCDWSSDVCSSDLVLENRVFLPMSPFTVNLLDVLSEAFYRSEERRVGKECRSRWSLHHKLRH